MLSVHNTHFYMKLMADIRTNLAAGTFATFRQEFIRRYRPSAKVLAAREAHRKANGG